MDYTSNGASAPTPAAPLSYTIPKKKRPLLDSSNHGTSANPTTPPMPQQQQQHQPEPPLMAPVAREHVNQLARSRLLKKRHRPDPSALSTCTAPWSSHRERPSDASKGFGETERAPHSGQRDDSVAAAEEGRVRCQGAQFPPSSSAEDQGNNRWQQRPQDVAAPAIAEAAMEVKATAQGSLMFGSEKPMMDVEGGSGVQPRDPQVAMRSPTGPNSANSGLSGSLTTSNIGSTDSAPAAPQPAPQQLTRAAWDGVSAAAAAAAAVVRDDGAVAVGAAASSYPVGQHIYGDTASGSWDPALRQSVADHARKHVSPQAKHRYSRSRAAMLDVKAEPVPLAAPPSVNRYGDAPAARDPVAQAAAHGMAQQQQQPAGNAGAAVHPHKRRRRALFAAAANAAADSGGGAVPGVGISASASAQGDAQRQAITEAPSRSSGGGQAKRVKSEGGERRARRAPRPPPQHQQQQQQQQAPPQQQEAPQQQAPPQQQRRRRSDGPRRPRSKAAAATVKAEAAVDANHMHTTVSATVPMAPAAGMLAAAAVAASAAAATPAGPTAAAAAAAAPAAAPAGAAAEAPASSRSGRARKPVLKFVSWEQGDLRTAAKGVRSGAPSGSRGDGSGGGAAAAPRSQSRRSASRKRPRSSSDAAAAAAAAAATTTMPVSAQHAQLSVAAAAAQPGAAAAGEAEVGGQGGEAAAAAAAPQQRRRRRPQRRVEESSESGSDEEGSGARAFDWCRLEEQAREVAAMIMAQKRLLGKGGSAAAAAGDAAAAAAAGAAAMGEDTDEDVCLRRSARAAGGGQLDSICVQKLLANLRADHRDVEVLKLHHYLSPDANTAVMDAVLDALAANSNCQALYMQNFNSGVTDDQIDALAAILRTHDRLWCLNLGELYKVTLDRWWKFCEELRGTHVTHMYLSEHVLTADLKTAMRDAIRANRAKHALHKDVDNLAVIERCTNMWWNPINARDLQVAMVQRGLSTRVRPRADPASKAHGGGGGGGAARFEPCSLHTDKSAAVLAGAAAAAIVLSGGSAAERCGGDACLSTFVAADGRGGGDSGGGGGGGDGAGCQDEVFGSGVGACGGGSSSIGGGGGGSGSCGGAVAQSGVSNYYCGGNSGAVHDNSISMPSITYGSIGGSAGGSVGGNGGVSKPAPARLIVEV